MVRCVGLVENSNLMYWKEAYTLLISCIFFYHQLWGLHCLLIQYSWHHLLFSFPKLIGDWIKGLVVLHSEKIRHEIIVFNDILFISNECIVIMSINSIIDSVGECCIPSVWGVTAVMRYLDRPLPHWFEFLPWGLVPSLVLHYPFWGDGALGKTHPCAPWDRTNNSRCLFFQRLTNIHHNSDPQEWAKEICVTFFVIFKEISKYFPRLSPTISSMNSIGRLCI